jgi:asparagine N-glycosylation enzyme membrane subunit Stt3
MYYGSLFVCLSVSFSCDHCSVYPTITASDYLFGILWPLYRLSNNYGFWLRLWYLVTIVLSIQQLRLLITSLVSCDHCNVYPTITASDYLFGILWPLYRLSNNYASDYLFGIFRLFLWPLYRLSNNYGFWLRLWYLVTIVMSIQQLRLLITSLEFCDHCIVYPTITASDYLFGILWPL